MRSRDFLVRSTVLVATMLFGVTATGVLASPRVPLGPRDDLTDAQAGKCPPMDDNGKVWGRNGDASVSGGKHNDWLMAKWHWDDKKGHDLTVEKWCINGSPEFESYFSLRVIQSVNKVEHVAVLPGVATPPPPTPTPRATPVKNPTPTPTPVETSAGTTQSRATPTPSPTPIPPHAGTC